MISAITPVSVFPTTANTLFVGDNWSNSVGSAPMFYYELRTVSGDTSETLKNGNVQMTPVQWNAWASTADDQNYIMSCVAKNLGLTLAK